MLHTEMKKMNLPKQIAKYCFRKARSICQSALVAYPKNVQCNICGWEGRNFLSDSWHKHINCPKCRSGVRHRLFFAALQNTNEFSFDKLINNKAILHFAPEAIISSSLQSKSAYYATADYLRRDCDFRINMCDMPEIKNESFDVVIAFDVLEHVPDYKKALEEVRRILSLKGVAIFTVPQKDNLSLTFEDPAIIAPEDRTKHFGQSDHLRIFGDDFPKNVEREGFTVSIISAATFSEDMRRRHVLSPPQLSKNPLATNYRMVYFCQKTSLGTMPS